MSKDFWPFLDAAYSIEESNLLRIDKKEGIFELLVKINPKASTSYYEYMKTAKRYLKIVETYLNCYSSKITFNQFTVDYPEYFL
jgi:hypothetical protein